MQQKRKTRRRETEDIKQRVRINARFYQGTKTGQWRQWFLQWRHQVALSEIERAAWVMKVWWMVHYNGRLKGNSLEEEDHKRRPEDEGSRK